MTFGNLALPIIGYEKYLKYLIKSTYKVDIGAYRGMKPLCIRKQTVSVN